MKESNKVYHANMAIAELTVCAREISDTKTYKQAQVSLKELKKLLEMLQDGKAQE